jgi:hypothetical protein
MGRGLYVISMKKKKIPIQDPILGSEVLTAVATKSTTVFCDITPCSPLKVSLRMCRWVDFQRTARCYIPIDSTFRISWHLLNTIRVTKSYGRRM